jgi:hypothetical protein
MKRCQMRGVAAAFTPFIEELVSFENVADLARKAEANEYG